MLKSKGFPQGPDSGAEGFVIHHNGFTCGCVMGREKLLPWSCFTNKDDSGVSQQEPHNFEVRELK